MIHVNFDPDARPGKLSRQQQAWWDAWKIRAKTATDEVLAAWESWRRNPKDETYDKFFDKPANTSVWGELKVWLLDNVFNKKCAYCETPVGRSVFHAEHYRPKGRVTTDGKKVKIKNDMNEDVDHPGYFWLAFHWKNLLPSCALCNTVNGKKNQFPIPENKSYRTIFKGLSKNELKALKEKLIQSSKWPDLFYLQPIDLDDKEGRLLLHPYFDEPRKSLRFDDFGEVIAIGNPEEKAQGEWSIRVYNLNSEDIKTERRRALDAADSAYTTAYRYHFGKGLSAHDARIKAKADVAGYIAGKEPYSAAVLDFLAANYPKYFQPPA
jgi:hypothetical protein